MAHGSGLPGAVVQRSLADWPVVLAAWLLLVCATTLLATGVVYGDAVATGGLHRALLAEPPADRAVVAALNADKPRIDDLDRVIRPQIERSIAAAGGEVVRVLRSAAFADRTVAVDQVHDLTVFESLDGIEAHARLVAGVWPSAGGEPLQATVSEAAATAMNLSVGDRLALVSRVDPALTVEVVIAGVWRADPADAFWVGDPLETTGSSSGGSFQNRGPLVVREADLVSIGGPRAAGGRVDVAWRGLPDVAALRLDGIDDLRTAIATLSAGFRGTLAPSDNPRVESAVPALLERVGRSVLVSRSGVILLTIQFAVLAGYAIVLVAGLLVERRRAEIALVRSRGASGLHLVAMALIESTYLAVPAAILAPWLALGVVTILGSVGPTAGLGIATSATVGSGAVIVSALAGVACVLALTLPTLFVSASPAGARAAEGRQARTTLAQRLGLDLALVAVAAVALWQLRLYGAPLTRNARGAFGLDPLLVAAPAIGLVGGAVLALRVVPRIAELGERLVVRGRGLVGSLGGRQLARRPLRYTRTALLLMLAAALGTLAAAHAATWSRSQADQAAYQAAADVRVVADDYSDLATWAAGPLYRSIPGVVAATPVAYAPIDVGRVVRAGRLIGLDPTATVVAATGATGPDGRERTALLDQLAANRPTTASVALAGSPVRMAVTIDADFRVDPDLRVDSDVGGAIPVDNRELHVSVLLADRDGRLLRAGSADGSITATGQRLVVALIEDTAQPLRPSGPLRLVGIEMTIVAPDNVAILGSVSIVSVETSEASTGDTAWTPVRLDPAGAGWRWDQLDQASRIEFPADPAAPYRVDVGREREIFGFPGSSGSSFRVFAGLSDEAILPAIASRRFLDQTSASVGETVAVDSLGRTLHVRLIAVADRFAPFDPDASFLITDLAALDALRLAATGATVQADEWWLAVDPVKSDGVLAELRQPASEARLVIGRDELTRTLSSDPVPLGLIGVLGLGSLAAMVFAGIGFLVSVTVSTSERLGEFALLRAIGLSVGQLALWLSIESIFLLVVGLIAGSLLGLLLAWLVLPFATLTQTGTAPVPAPIVLVPWEAIAPVYGVAVVLFVVSIWLVRRQLPDIRISGVLRARGG